MAWLLSLKTIITIIINMTRKKRVAFVCCAFGDGCVLFEFCAVYALICCFFSLALILCVFTVLSLCIIYWFNFSSWSSFHYYFCLFFSLCSLRAITVCTAYTEYVYLLVCLLIRLFVCFSVGNCDSCRKRDPRLISRVSLKANQTRYTDGNCSVQKASERERETSNIKSKLIRCRVYILILYKHIHPCGVDWLISALANMRCDVCMAGFCMRCTYFSL